MRRANQLALTTLFIAGVVFAASLAECKEPPTSPPKTERDEAKQKAITRAGVVPTQMRFDLTKYFCMSVDKNEPPSVLNDSDIGPFVVPVALEADWWIVLFLPRNPELGPPICVYLDKRLDVVRGYVIGPPRKRKGALEESAPKK